MRYFIDTEFYIEPGGQYAFPINPLSIGVVAQDGRRYYAETPISDLAIDWPAFHRKHVLPGFFHRNGHCSCVSNGPTCPIRTGEEIAHDLLSFIGSDRPEVWVWCGAYDFVVVSQLFGPLENWPKRWPYYFCDVQQEYDRRDLLIPESLRKSSHNALEDAADVANMLAYLKGIDA